MHESVLKWARAVVAALALAERDTLEVGARNVNGSLRSLFRGRYLGVDIAPGPGVDEIMDAHDLTFADEVFDVVVCTEMLEHDSAPWLTAREIARVLRPNGVALITARGIGFPRHDYPSDYWRFTEDGIRALCRWAGLTVAQIREDEQYPGVMTVAVK